MKFTSLKFGLILLAGAVVLGLVGAQEGFGDDRTQTESILSNLNKNIPQGSVPGGGRAAIEGVWVAEEITGNVLYQDVPGGAWVDLSSGEVVNAGGTVKTGSDGWAVLGRGKDRIAIAAGTQLSFPGSPPNGDTHILQDIGSALFQVDKKPGRAFEVETPYLTAGVKGTVFGVSVSNAGAQVSVTEGRVSVSPASGGKSVDVTIGLTAKVAPGPRAEVTMGPTSQSEVPGLGAAQTPGKATAPGQGLSPDRARGVGPGTGNGNSGGNSGGNGAGSDNSSSNGAGGGNSGGNGNGGGNSGGNGTGGGNSGGNGNGGGNSGGNGAGGGNSGGNGNGGGNSGNNGNGKGRSG